MKCEVYLELLEEYLDGELSGEDSKRVDAHLNACTDCADGFTALTAEQELFARYDRAVEVPPFLWTRVAAHTVAENNKPKRSWLAWVGARPATAIALVLLAITLGVVYLLSRQPAAEIHAKDQTPKAAPTNPKPPAIVQAPQADLTTPAKPEFVAVKKQTKGRVVQKANRTTVDQSGVLSSDPGYLDMDEQDTARHIEQTENLLRSIRNLPVSDSEEEIDVTYDKALSRRLLNENVVLRRDAEMKAKFPTKTLLADLEPFLIDIANLPDRARPEDVRVIKERVQKTEIVAALLDYQDRGTNNR